MARSRPMPSSTHGKICYLEIPALDIERSSAFYRDVFGWSLRRRGDGATAFDDATGQVSGSWRLGRPPSETVGVLVYIMVDDAAATVAALERHGAVILQPIGADPGELTARFRDPGGNVFGIYQQPPSRG